MYDQTRVVKPLVLVAVCLAACYYFWKSASYPPPEDPWFRSAVLDRSGPVLVKFGANWCGPCRMLDGELPNLESTQVVKIDVDERPNLARHYGVSAIPRMLLFKNGKVIGDRVGYASAADLQAWIANQTR